MRRRQSTFDDNDSTNESLDMDFNDEMDLANDQYEEDIYSDLADDFDDICEPKSIEDELKEEKKQRKKEFYVKGADLKAEIQKYHDSKKTTEDR